MQIIEVRKKDTYLRKPGFSLSLKTNFKMISEQSLLRVQNQIKPNQFNET